MAFAEDLSPFFADYAITALIDDRSVSVILNKEGLEVLSGRAQTVDYMMYYRTADFPDLEHGKQVFVDGANYMVIQSQLEGDGQISCAKLQRQQRE